MKKLIIKLIPKEEINLILPLLKLINENTEENILEERLQMMSEHSYQCIGVFEEDKLVGICGFWILVKHYIGKHIEPDNVVIHPNYRSEGIGDKMMAWIYQYGKSEGCVASELNCYTNNESGLKFWLNQGYEQIGVHLRKLL